MWADNETTQDLLGYQVHAELLKKIILDGSMLPISIGIFGNWGSGKSSLMLLLQEEIEQWKRGVEAGLENGNARVLQVCFNSWQFEGYESTKLTMIETILEELRKDIDGRKDLFEKVDDFVARISFLKAGLFILRKAYDNLIPQKIKVWLPNQEDIDKITGDERCNRY